jgi:hypothetical protein
MGMERMISNRALSSILIEQIRKIRKIRKIRDGIFHQGTHPARTVTEMDNKS